MLFRRVWQQEIYVNDEGIGCLKLTHPDGRGGVHLVDVDMLPLIEPYLWHEYDPHGYASARIDGPELSLHRLVMGLGRGQKGVIDHLDRNPRNSQRSNMVVTTSRGNAMNRSSTNGDGMHNIHSTRWGFLIHAKFAGVQPYTAQIKDLDKAKKCRDAFLSIAHEFDLGLRAAPTKSELLALANSIRAQ